MLKEAVFTMKLEPELRDAFMAEAEATHRPASQIVRELMRDFVLRQREAREYDAFLRDKVEAARASMQAGEGRPDEEVEARFAARRAAALRQAEASGGRRSSGRPKPSWIGKRSSTTSPPIIRALPCGWTSCSTRRSRDCAGFLCSAAPAR